MSSRPTILTLQPAGCDALALDLLSLGYRAFVELTLSVELMLGDTRSCKARSLVF